jgi:hypothetical protein
MSLRFFNCPDCNQPCFVFDKEEDDEISVTCECGTNFCVSADTHPFEMAGIEPEQA